METVLKAGGLLTRGGDVVVDTLRKALLMQWPYITEICLFGFCVGASIRVRPIKAYSWLHHLVMVFLTGFAGSTFTPMFFARMPVLFINDLVVPFVCIAWYLVHHSYLSKLFQGRSMVFPFVIVPYEVFRANMIMRFIDEAATAIPPSPYYSIPVFGPILIGTLYGSLGAFMPFDRDLTWIQGGVPQPLQMTFLASTFYHLALNDPHLLGAYLRGLPLLNLKNPGNLKALVVVFFSTTALMSWALGSDYNLLEPLHRVLYKITGLPLSPRTEEQRARQQQSVAPATNGTSAAHTDEVVKKPSPAPGKATSRIGTIAKLVVPAAAVLGNMFWSGPRMSLTVGQKLRQGDYITSCPTWDRYAGKCKQHYLTINSEGNLALYKGDSPQARKSELLWQSRSKRRSQGLPEAGFYAELSDDGSLTVKHRDCSMVYWSNVKKTKAPEGLKPVVKISSQGTFGVYAGDEALWISD